MAKPSPGLSGCELVVLTHEEAEQVAEDDCLAP
jgi:hypothetical protein